MFCEQAQSLEMMRGHRLFSSLSLSRHAESSCFPVFSRPFSSSLIALSVSFSILLSVSVFPRTPLKKAPSPSVLAAQTRWEISLLSLTRLCVPFLFLPILSDSVNLCFLTLVGNPFAQLVGDTHSCVSEEPDVGRWFSSYLRGTLDLTC